jgi:hypothetical protein
MKFASIERQLKDLEHEAHATQTPSIDDDGRPAWIDGSGLHVAFEIMHIERSLGRETTIEDFPPDLLTQVRLWSQAKLSESDGQAAKITKELCQKILAEGHR